MYVCVYEFWFGCAIMTLSVQGKASGVETRRCNLYSFISVSATAVLGGQLATFRIHSTCNRELSRAFESCDGDNWLSGAISGLEDAFDGSTENA